MGAQQHEPTLDPIGRGLTTLDPIGTGLAKVFQLHRVPPLGMKSFLSCESMAALLLDGVSRKWGQPSALQPCTLCLPAWLLMGISLVGPCDSQPCQNGGTCIPEGVDRYHCLCPLAFGGEVNCGMYAWTPGLTHWQQARPGLTLPVVPCSLLSRKQLEEFQPTFFPHSPRIRCMVWPQALCD